MGGQARLLNGKCRRGGVSVLRRASGTPVIKRLIEIVLRENIYLHAPM